MIQTHRHHCQHICITYTYFHHICAFTHKHGKQVHTMNDTFIYILLSQIHEKRKQTNIIIIAYSSRMISVQTIQYSCLFSLRQFTRITTKLTHKCQTKIEIDFLHSYLIADIDDILRSNDFFTPITIQIFTIALNQVETFHYIHIFFQLRFNQ